MTDDDRRNNFRAPIELKVEYKRLNTFFYDYTKNISKGGTFIKTDRPLEIGTVFVFRLSIPSLASPLALRGEVRWVVRAGEPFPDTVLEGQDTGMGIRFVYDSLDQRAVIEEAVEKLMVGSLGLRIFANLVKPDKESP
jgi:type IV pilus assembly protein PilZ